MKRVARIEVILVNNGPTYPSSFDDVCNHDNDTYTLIPDRAPKVSKCVFHRT